jgi:hypothetical protein
MSESDLRSEILDFRGCVRMYNRLESPALGNSLKNESAGNPWRASR